MTILGARALIDIALPTGVDATEVLRFQMEQGMNPEQVIAEAAAVIGTVNEALVQQYGGLFYITESNYAREEQGDSARSMTPKHAEFAAADPVRADQIGRMLPRDDYQDANAWTRKFLERADRDLLRFDLNLIARRWRNRVDFDVLTRILTNTENAIGSAGWDVPWAIGTGMNVNYIPPQWRGYTFDSTHTHFDWYNGTPAAQAATALTAAVLDLRHHGIEGRLTALVSEADIAAYTAISPGFAQFVPNGITTTGGATGTPIFTVQGELSGIPGEIFGYYLSNRGVVELRYHERIPTGYGFMTKSYGVNVPQNPLAIRVDKGGGFGLRVRPQVTNDMHQELDHLRFDATHGVGVNSRTGGVAFYMASGAAAWVNPTIS